MTSSTRLNSVTLTRPIMLRLNRMFFRAMPRHPLFWRDFEALQYPSRSKPRKYKVQWANAPLFRQVIRFGTPVVALLIICPAIMVLAIPGLALFPFLVLAGGSLIGVNAALGVSSSVADEYQNGRWDVVALTPPGLVGANWALAARFLRTNQRLRQMHRLISGIFVTIVLWVIFGVGLTSLLLLDSSSLGLVREDAVALPINTLMFVGLLYVDARLSTIVGALIGMAMPTFTVSRLDASINALVMFLTTQFVTYVVIFVAAFLLPGTLLAALGVEGWFLHSLIHCTLALVVREFGLWIVWQWAAERLNTDLTELESLASPTYF